MRKNYLTEFLQNGKFENSLDIIQMIGKGIYAKVSQVRDKLTSEVCAMKTIKIKSIKHKKKENFFSFKILLLL